MPSIIFPINEPHRSPLPLVSSGNGGTPTQGSRERWTAKRKIACQHQQSRGSAMVGELYWVERIYSFTLPSAGDCA